MSVQLDLNNPEFQKQWFALTKEDQLSVLACCQKVAGMEWTGIYRDQGLRWELIQSRTGPNQERLYSIRMSRRLRAIVKRSGEFIEFLSLHADHDSAYRPN